MDTLASIQHLASITPRYTHGHFSFEFGNIEYVDAHTLEIQYREIFLQGLYDIDIIPDGGRIVDCGANIGLSLIGCALRHPKCQVIGYEADPQIFEVCLRNIKRLGLTNVDLICAAVGAHNGTESFIVEGGEGGRVSKEGTLVVPSIRLNDIISEQAVDLLKLDIEGSEWITLTDMCKSGILSSINNLIVEFHGTDTWQRTLPEILISLSDAGFKYTFPWSFCEPGLAGREEPTPYPFAPDGKYIMFLHAWRKEDVELSNNESLSIPQLRYRSADIHECSIRS